jgi:type IV secretion system protein TrbL
MNPDVPNQILQMFQPFLNGWIATMHAASLTLFRDLITVTFMWGVLTFAIRRQATIEHMGLWLLYEGVMIGLYLFLIQNDIGISRSIINTFQQWAATGSGIKTLSPGNMFARGLNVANALLSTSNIVAYLKSPAAAFFIDISAVLIGLGFFVITATMWMVYLEIYVCFGVVIIYFGFLGSEVTRDHAMKGFSLLIQQGIKLLIVFFLAGAAFALSAVLLAEAKAIGTPKTPLTPQMSVFAILGATSLMTLAMLGIPKYYSSLAHGISHAAAGDMLREAGAAVGTTIAAVSVFSSIGSKFSGPVGGGANTSSPESGTTESSAAVAAAGGDGAAAVPDNPAPEAVEDLDEHAVNPPVEVMAGE